MPTPSTLVGVPERVKTRPTETLTPALSQRERGQKCKTGAGLNAKHSPTAGGSSPHATPKKATKPAKITEKQTTKTTDPQTSIKTEADVPYNTAPPSV
jgi:hypothetical protein